MKSNLSDMFRSGVVWIMPLAMASIVATACSDDDSGFAGGSTEDTGIVANLDVAGVSQKGPFVKGATVTVATRATLLSRMSRSSLRAHCSR